MTLTSEAAGATATGSAAAVPEQTGAARPMRKDAARNRELLIAAAREVFAQRGFEASLDDVARHAGLGVGTAYRHFANKRELAEALIEQAVDKIVALAEHSLTVENPWNGVVLFLEGALEVQAADRGLREVLTGLHDPERLDRIHDRLLAVTTELLDRCRDRGLVRRDVQISDLGFVMTMVCSVQDVGGDLAPELWRRYLAMCLEGLKPGGAALPVPALAEQDFRTAMATYKMG